MRLALWPAIDLSEGRVVRLLRGELGAKTVYEIDPGDVARRFADEGADGIHVVDLDAAFGRGDNRAAIGEILAAVRVSVQVGGGLRTLAGIDGVLASGARRAVLGSLPFTEPALFAEAFARHGERIVVALDCRGGRPAIRGWTADAGAGTAAEAASRLAGAGVGSLLVTDVARDGAMEGPNLDLLAQVRAVFPGEVLASGGIRGEEDLLPVGEALSGGPAGAILGRAVHGGRTTVARLRAALGGVAGAGGKR